MAPEFPKHNRHRKNYNQPGDAHELTFTCYQRFPFLSKELPCQWLIESIENARQNLNFEVWAWVFMPEHVHMIVYPKNQRYDIAFIRRLIKEPVAMRAIAWLKENDPSWLKKIERKRGERTERKFWQSGGGYDRNITEKNTLLNMIDYIHENPVRKGFTHRAQDWYWSSASWYLEQKTGPLPTDRIPVDWM